VAIVTDDCRTRPRIPAQRLPAEDQPLIDLSAPPSRPSAHRRPAPFVALAAIAVFLAGGAGYAVLRPDPAPAPAPAVTAESPVPAASPPGRTAIPEAAADPVRRR
jgi:hypothetical protein